DLLPLLSFPTRRSSDLCFVTLPVECRMRISSPLCVFAASFWRCSHRTSFFILIDPCQQSRPADDFPSAERNYRDWRAPWHSARRSEEHTSELQSLAYLV